MPRDASERRFLSLPQPEPRQAPMPARAPVPTGSPEAARRLFTMSQPIGRTLVGTYLRNRGIEVVHHAGALRYHPRCYYRPDDGSPVQRRPAMIAAVTDLEGEITGAHRTWLAPDGSGKAALDTPRRAMGGLLGHAVRFGAVDDALAVGEGIETMLSLRLALPAMPMAAALSANHLAALLLPPSLRRLYIANDADAAGDMALAALTERAVAAGIEALTLSPRRGDFNDDLHAFGVRELRAALPARTARRRAFPAPGNGHGGLTDGGFGPSRPNRRPGRPNCSGSAWKLPLSSGGNRHEEPSPDMTLRHREAKDEAANLNIEATPWRTTSPM